MDVVGALGLGWLFLTLLALLIFITILRWVLRINHIVARLDNIIDRLDDIINNGIEVEIASDEVDKKRKLGKNPKSFMDGLKKGMEI